MRTILWTSLSRDRRRVSGESRTSGPAASVVVTTRPDPTVLNLTRVDSTNAVSADSLKKELDVLRTAVCGDYPNFEELGPWLRINIPQAGDLQHVF